MRLDRTDALHAGLLLVLAAIIALLSACAGDPPARGSAQDQAATASARADETRTAADGAAVDAAIAAAEAAAARAAAQRAEAAATSQPTSERIAAAADARVAAARAEERAAAAQAVAAALAQVATQADQAAAEKAERARAERTAEAKADDLRQWITLCRWIGLGGVAGGALLGGALWMIAPRLAAPAAGLLAGTGLLVVAFGATITWLPLVLAAVVAIAAAIWLLAHLRHQRFSLELSRTVDALEGRAKGTLDEAKKDLGKALDRTGLRSRYLRARGLWRRAASTTHTTTAHIEHA